MIYSRGKDGQWQRGDALRLYLTGAATPGGVQASQAASLGGLRSASEVGGMAFLIRRPIPNVKIEFVAGANGSGVGRLEAMQGDYLRWAAPGGSVGPAAKVSSGQTVRLESASAPGQFVRATRTSGTRLAGSASVQLMPPVNDVLGQSNGAVGDGKTYRCVCFKAGPYAIIEDLKIWIAAAGIARIGLEDPATQPDGAFSTIANQGVAPAGVSFVAPDAPDHADVLVKAALGAGEQVGLWLERDLSAAADSAWARSAIGWSFKAIG